MVEEARTEAARDEEKRWGGEFRHDRLLDTLGPFSFLLRT